ncbi:MAG: Adenylosuccinate lyase C-terminal, partial [Bacteroidota bacterium]
VTKERVHAFIDELQVPDQIKTELKQINPSNYVGIQLVP